MNDSTQTLIRSVLKIGAGYALAKGWADDAQVQVIASGVVALAAVIWGLLHRTSGGSPPAATKGLGLLLFGLAVMLPASGCQSGPERTAYNVAKAPAVTVEQTMTAWGDYVAKFHPGPATELKVRAAFEKAKAAELVAIDAAHAYANAASGTNSVPQQLQSALLSQQAADALSELLALLQTFGLKP